MSERARIMRTLLAEGRPVSAETVDVVLAAGEWLAGSPPQRWRPDDVLALAWYGVVRWCRSTGRTLPEGCDVVLGVLARQLDPDGSGALSDAVATLAGGREPAGAATADGGAGVRRRPTRTPARRSS